MCLQSKYLSIIVIVVLLVACKKPIPTKVKITINKIETAPVTIKIHHHPKFGELVLGEIKLDSVNTAILELEVLNPFMSNIQIGDINTTIFLEPGYDLTISIEGDSLNKKLVFTGKNADANNYLSQVSSIYNKGWEREIINLELVNFLARYDSIKTELANFHKDYIDTHTLSSEVTELIENTNTIQLLKIRMTYTYHFHTSALVDQIYAFRDKKNIEPFVMPFRTKGCCYGNTF